MGKFLNSRRWLGVLDAFEGLAGGAFDHLNYQHTREFEQIFQKSQMPGVLRGGSMGCFGVGQYKMQTTDCCRPLFSPCNQNETKIVPLTQEKIPNSQDW